MSYSILFLFESYAKNENYSFKITWKWSIRVQPDNVKKANMKVRLRANFWGGSRSWVIVLFYFHFWWCWKLTLIVLAYSNEFSSILFQFEAFSLLGVYFKDSFCFISLFCLIVFLLFHETLFFLFINARASVFYN